VKNLYSEKYGTLKKLKMTLEDGKNPNICGLAEPILRK
jgi:hypothetical protein